MVGPSGLSALSVVTFWSFWASSPCLALPAAAGNSSCEHVDPKHRMFTDKFIADTCIYIRVQSPELDWTASKNACESIGQSSEKWHLFEPYTAEEHKKFQQLVTTKLGIRDFWVWIGLVREAAKGTGNLNEKIWSDRSKWHWTSGNSTLKTPFWKSPDPNGWNFYGNQRCVVAIKESTTTSMFWWDELCTGGFHHESHQILGCQSIAVKATTRKPTAKPALDLIRSPWTWVVTGVILINIIVILVIIAVYKYRKRRRETPRTDAGGHYETLSQLKKAEKETSLLHKSAKLEKSGAIDAKKKQSPNASLDDKQKAGPKFFDEQPKKYPDRKSPKSEVRNLPAAPVKKFPEEPRHKPAAYESNFSVGFDKGRNQGRAKPEPKVEKKQEKKDKPEPTRDHKPRQSRDHKPEPMRDHRPKPSRDHKPEPGRDHKPRPSREHKPEHMKPRHTRTSTRHKRSPPREPEKRKRHQRH